MKIAPYLTIEDFCRDPENVEALASFLESPAGQNLLSVLLGNRPSRILADARIARDGNGLRAAAASESLDGRPEYLLGRSDGYESVVEIITQNLTQKVRSLPRSSTKAGAHKAEITPASPPKP